MQSDTQAAGELEGRDRVDDAEASRASTRPKLPDAVRPTAAPTDAVGGGPPVESAFAKQMRLAAESGTGSSASMRRKPRRGRRSLFRFVLALGVLPGSVASGTTVYRRLQAESPAATYPAAWDPAVAEAAAFVETARGLEFQHPVFVDFLPEAEFVALFETPVAAAEAASESTAAADHDAQLDGGVLDAAALATGYDPIDSQTISQTTILGFYDFDSERITIRGTDVTAAVRLVLVHELTHVLQHQWFDPLTGGDDDFALRSVLEADAMRIEDAYLATLSDNDRAEAVTGTSSDEGTDAALASVPSPLVDQAQAPYVLGPMFLAAVIERDGRAAVDGVYTQLPTIEELIEPALYGTSGPAPVVDVVAPAAAVVFDELRPWSMYDALLMLDAWLGWRDARTALDGWNGSGFVAYEQGAAGGPVCFGAGVRFDAAEQASRFAVALSAWAAASGSGAAPAVEGSVVRFEACARGEGAAEPPVSEVLTSEAVLIEHRLVADLEGRAPTLAHPWYQCVVRALIDDPSFADLVWVVEVSAEQQAIVDEAVNVARWLCGPQPG